MSRNTNIPFRADHVGSLPRPEWLLDARDAKAEGKISADELRALQDDGTSGRRTQIPATGDEPDHAGDQR